MKTILDPEKIESFLTSFADRGRCRSQCACGKTYYRDDDVDWEDGELEWLEENGIELDCAVGVFTINNRDYVDSCDCWHKEVKAVMDFIDENAHRIAQYLKEEKMRKEGIAKRAVTIPESVLS